MYLDIVYSDLNYIVPARYSKFSDNYHILSILSYYSFARSTLKAQKVDIVLQKLSISLQILLVIV